jgi:hypothetical protein
MPLSWLEVTITALTISAHTAKSPAILKTNTGKSSSILKRTTKRMIANANVIAGAAGIVTVKGSLRGPRI